MTVDLKLLAARASRGDRAAFGTIVHETKDVLYRLAARMMGHTGDAEDVLQEAYVKVYRALTGGRFDGRSGVRTWMYRIVANTAIDALRARERREEPAEPQSARFDGAVGQEAKLALREIAEWLADLPAEQRAALVLRTVEGLTTPEVAQILGCSDEAVEQRLVRARATLRKRRGSDD